MTQSKGRLVQSDKKFFATIETTFGTTEVPVFAETLEEAVDAADLKYTSAGLRVVRVRPDRIVQ